jgi:hypothetical protein
VEIAIQLLDLSVQLIEPARRGRLLPVGVSRRRCGCWWPIVGQSALSME